MRSTGTDAAIEFVQITDPHVFDKKREDEEVENRAAFAACINEINRLHTSHPSNNNHRFSFVAMTGDMGLDKFGRVDDAAWTNGVTVSRDLLINSAVKTWLFIPGNNDLDGEIPTNIWKYHLFLEQLSNALHNASPGFRILDLCPSAPNNREGSVSRTYTVGDRYHFIGFDNASFKNENTSTQAKQFSANEVQNTKNVLGELTKVNNGFAYILYHIPEIDDPFLVFNTTANIEARQTEKSLIKDELVYSAWMVDPAVRQEWENIVLQPKVRGLIAGHFHSERREAYRGFGWLKANYAAVSSGKLFIAPPIACKFQTNSAATARGFCVYLADETGQLVATTHWLQNGKFEQDLLPNPTVGSAPTQPIVKQPPLD